MKPGSSIFSDLQNVAKQFGVKTLAGLMETRPGILYNKLNNHGSAVRKHHKPSLLDFIQILRITQNLKPLESMCREFDGVFYRLPDMTHVTDDTLFDIVNRVHSEGGDVHREMNKALEDGIVTAEEFSVVEREINEWLGAILELKARFKSLVVTQPDAQATA